MGGLLLQLVNVLLFTVTLTTAYKSYDGYQVLRVDIENDLQRNYLYSLYAADVYDFWTERFAVNMTADIMVGPNEINLLSGALAEYEFKFYPMISDVDRAIQNSKSNRCSSSFNFDDYHRYDVQLAYIDELAASHDFMTVTTVGQSFEGRDIKRIALETGLKRTKPAIYLDAGTHAREWISPAVGLWVLTELVTNANYKHLLDAFDVYIVPNVNPDGYEYAHTSDRMWRKTRNVNEGSRCIGTDPNRNFGYHWGETGCSSDPCSDQYKGSAAMSEPEMQAVKTAASPLQGRLKLFLTLHSYSQLFLSVYGYNYNKYPDNHQEHQELGNVMATALKAVHGKTFDVGNSVDLLYPAAGATDDYGKGVMGAEFSFTTELRDTGHYGFLLPPDQIIPSGEEYMAAVEAGLKHLMP